MVNREAAVNVAVEQQLSSFYGRFVRLVTGGMAAVAILMATLFVTISPDPIITGAAVAALAVCGVSYFLAARGRYHLGLQIFVYGISIIGTAASLLRGGEFELRALPGIYFVMVALAGFILGSRAALSLGVLDVASLTGVYVSYGFQHGFNAEIVLALSFLALMLLFETAAVVLFVRQAQSYRDGLQGRLADIDRVVVQARRIAAGDLLTEIEGQGEVSGVLREMQHSLRHLVKQIRETASNLAAATTEISSMSRQQEQGALEQASAVSEIRQTLNILSDSSGEIATSAQGVVNVAEATLKNNELIADRIRLLTGHTQRIAEILEIIKEIANKSELLALNASLEGAKAGEAGRGFSLVAAQMQRLAENVMASVKDVKTLTADIREATNSTILSTETGTKLAAEATQAARQISIHTQQQRSSTEQVSIAMNDIAQVASQVASGSSQTLSASNDLGALSHRLSQLVLAFQV